MQYPAIVTHHEEDVLVVVFPDLQGCYTQINPGEDFDAVAQECLNGCLADDLAARAVPPLPQRHRAPKHGEVKYVRVSPSLAARVQLRQARTAAGLTQTELARRIGVSQQQVARLENPDSDLMLGTLDRAARALGLALDINLVKDAA